MADGSLDDSEGNAIKHWIKKAIAPFSGNYTRTLSTQMQIEITTSKVVFHTNYLRKYKIFVNFNQTTRIFTFFRSILTEFFT